MKTQKIKIYYRREWTRKSADRLNDRGENDYRIIERQVDEASCTIRVPTKDALDKLGKRIKAAGRLSKIQDDNARLAIIAQKDALKCFNSVRKLYRGEARCMGEGRLDYESFWRRVYQRRNWDVHANRLWELAKMHLGAEVRGQGSGVRG